MTAPTPRTTLRRLPERGHHDRATVDAILDEALVCHLGLVDPEGRPFVIPTIHARAGDHLYVHGSPASRALRSEDVCFVALVDTGNLTPDPDDQLSEECIDLGWNLEFRLIRREGASAAGGTSVSATCELSQQPTVDCPNLPN